MIKTLDEFYSLLADNRNYHWGCGDFDAKPDELCHLHADGGAYICIIPEDQCDIEAILADEHDPEFDCWLELTPDWEEDGTHYVFMTFNGQYTKLRWETVLDMAHCRGAYEI